MTTSDIIALGALAFSLISFILSLLTSTKRYELYSAARTELLEWYACTLKCLVCLKECVFANHMNKEKKIELLAELSSLIELGRFYFPNKPDKRFGVGKPRAYRGYRNIMLEFLVYSYNIYKTDNPSSHIKHAIGLQRLFTSEMIRIVSPQKFHSRLRKHTGMKVNSNLSLEDYLKSNPDNAESFFFYS